MRKNERYSLRFHLQCVFSNYGNTRLVLYEPTNISQFLNPQYKNWENDFICVLPGSVLAGWWTKDLFRIYIATSTCVSFCCKTKFLRDPLYCFSLWNILDVSWTLIWMLFKAHYFFPTVKFQNWLKTPFKMKQFFFQ